MNITRLKQLILVVMAVIIATSCTTNYEFILEEEKEVALSIENSIGWALEKDTTLLFNIISNNADLLILNPDSSKIEGIEAFRKVTNSVWMNPKFIATHYEVQDLKISFSKNSKVAWFYCLLDDFCEWDGRKIGWDNVRWTGVLEKENDDWVIQQMHFSFPNK